MVCWSLFIIYHFFVFFQKSFFCTIPNISKYYQKLNQKILTLHFQLLSFYRKTKVPHNLARHVCTFILSQLSSKYYLFLSKVLIAPRNYLHIKEWTKLQTLNISMHFPNYSKCFKDVKPLLYVLLHTKPPLI